MWDSRSYYRNLFPPSGCQACGISERAHWQRWSPEAGWHSWQPPTQETILERMKKRRELQ